MGDMLRQDAEAALPAVPGLVWWPGEQVLLLAVGMPALRPAQQRSAVGFAVEDRIGVPLEAVHVVLGPRLAARAGEAVGQQAAHLVAVIGRGELAAGMARAGAQKGAQTVRLVPDVLALPRPAEGWAVLELGGRVLVRLADGSGFAAGVDQVALFWRLAGGPSVTLYGGALPDAVPVAARAVLPPPDPAMLRFDLAAGGQTGRGLRVPRGVWAVAAVLLVAAGLHLGLLAADVLALGRQAAAGGARLEAALLAAGQPAGLAVETALARALAAAEPASEASFLRLLGQMSQALAGLDVRLQSLTWGQAGEGAATLSVTMEAADLGSLQSAETALTRAGLGVKAGAATSGEGAAEVQMTLSEGGA